MEEREREMKQEIVAVKLYAKFKTNHILEHSTY